MVPTELAYGDAECGMRSATRYSPELVPICLAIKAIHTKRGERSLGGCQVTKF